MKLKYNILFLLIPLFLSCTDDLEMFDIPSESVVDEEAVEAYLSLSINKMTLSSGGSRAEEEETRSEESTSIELEAAENRIDDIWVFQFDATPKEDGKHYELIKPIYYNISNQEELKNLKVLLKEDKASYICVVANTKNSAWAKASGFDTYEGLKLKTLTNALPIFESDLINNDVTLRRSIPMEGENIGEQNDNSEETPSSEGIIIAAGNTVTVNVSRMFAKINISFGKICEGMSKISMSIGDIPYFCRVKSLEIGLDEQNVSSEYPTSSNTWISRDVNLETYDEDIIIYIPENLHGESDNVQGEDKTNKVPDGHPLKLDLKMKYNSQDIDYVIYPGGNTYNNFNIKRNKKYNVKINIYSPTNNMYSPSSNCFVVETNSEVVFEPHYRTETGGIDGSDSDDIFVFSNYLNSEKNEDGSYKYPGKTIDEVRIIWQTKNAIGDNSEGKLVQFEPNEDNPLHSKIRVHTGDTEGNALIGAYNSEGVLLWSWHIWVTNNNPGNIGNAVVYTTYDWDSEKIYSYQQGIDDGVKYERIPGYGIMPCNLGALAIEPASTSEADEIKTYGMLYQWGRKDPFPPAAKNHIAANDLWQYSDTYTGIHYDNTNNNKIPKTYQVEEDNSESFHTKLGQTIIGDPINYSIKFPMVFITGTSSSPTVSKPTDFYASGDWMIVHNQKLWGGISQTDDMVKLEIPGEKGKYMYKNFGDQKTIFDPCPKGWRVPPGDLWLGFTKTGGNPSAIDDINYDKTATDKTPGGMYLYIRESKWGNTAPGKSLYFPCQGLRLSNGIIYSAGTCGNYHNATSDEKNYVNILHVHRNSTLFHVFEYSITYYNVKSLGGPVRCVRDRR